MKTNNNVNGSTENQTEKTKPEKVPHLFRGAFLAIIDTSNMNLETKFEPGKSFLGKKILFAILSVDRDNKKIFTPITEKDFFEFVEDPIYSE